MNTEEIRSMSDAQLRTELEESRRELFNVRRDLALRKFKNHQRLPEVKRDIARIMTVLRERELMRKYGGAELEPEGETAPAAQQAPRRRGLFGRR